MWTLCYIYLGCITLSHPPNGTVRVINTTNVIAQYECEFGFQLEGSKTRECINDTWTGTEPSCQGMQYLPVYQK